MRRWSNVLRGSTPAVEYFRPSQAISNLSEENAMGTAYGELDAMRRERRNAG
jgi:hypothetical protein